MKLLLMAGHGNGDPGTIGNGCREADLTREFVKLIDSALADYCDVDIFNLSQDPYRWLQTHKLDFTKYDYTLEIHFNSASNTPDDGKTTGTEIFVAPNRANSKLERLICERFAQFGLYNRGVKTSTSLQNLNIARKQGAAYSLLEVCFISDADDVRIYTQNKQKLAEAVKFCFCEAFNLKGGKDMAKEKNANKTENNAQNQYSYDNTVENLIKLGITDRANMQHWEKALSGSIPLVPSNVRAIFDRLIERVK